MIGECTGCHYAELDEDHSICTTPDTRAELLSMQSCFATSFDLSADSECTYDSQISPASVLPEPYRPPLKVCYAVQHHSKSVAVLQLDLT